MSEKSREDYEILGVREWKALIPVQQTKQAWFLTKTSMVILSQFYVDMIQNLKT